MLELRNLRKTFKTTHALRGVSFSVGRGEAVGLVGESGSGKSTAAKLAARLMRPDSGRVLFEGGDLAELRGVDLERFRQKTQIIFQQPYSSLDPRLSVGVSLAEPFQLRGTTGAAARRDKVHELLASVELPSALSMRLPHEISGGECQRVALARALSQDPELLICDEPVSSLDLLAQARVLNLLLRLQKMRRISLLFISHDLRVIRHLCDKVVVLKEGEVCETGLISEVFANPQHPYTKELLFSSGLGYNGPLP